MSPLEQQPLKAAFEISKGPRHVMTLSESDVEAMEDMVAANLAYQRARREGSGGVMVW